MLGFGLGVTDLVVQRPGGTPLPALDLNFLAGALPSGVTFTRASAASYIGSDGLLKTAASGAPRFDHAITTPTVNLLLQSEQFDNAAWAKTRATVSANVSTITDPFGGTSADKLVEDTTASNNHFTNATVPVTATATYTSSVYVKAGERTFGRLRLGGAAFIAEIVFNLTAGTVTPNPAPTPCGISPVGGGGWYRIWLTAAAAVGDTTMTASLYLRNASNIEAYTGDGASGFYIFGGQLEQSASVGTYVPTFGIPSRIGGSTTNLRTNSADMAAVFGTQEACSFSANVVAAPDGTTTADKMVEDGTTGNHRLRSSVTVASVATVHTSSIYMKAAGRTSATLVLADSTSSVANNVAVTANLSNGTLGSVLTGGTGIAGTASISDAGGGWYRVALSGSFPGGTSFATWITLGSYAGDSTSGVYLWGAQLEAASSLGPYVATTTAAATAHATEARGLLIEESRANLAPGQMSSTTYWTTLNTSTPTGATAPDGSTSAVTLTEIGTNGTTNYGANLASGSIPTIAAGPVTASIFVKAGTAPFFRLIVSDATTPTIGAQIYFSFATGAITLTGSQAGSPTAISSSVQAFPNGWYRLTLTVTLGAATTATMLLRLTSASGTSTDIGGNTALVWGPQLEVGSFATSYVPTTTASVTRAADAAAVGTLTPWHNASEGTLMVEASRFGAGAFGRFAQFDDGTTSANSIAILTGAAGLRTYAYIGTANVSQFDTSASANDLTLGVPAKAAIAYKANDAAFCFNGGGVSTDTSVTLPTVTQLRMGPPGALNGHIRKIRYFRSRLPNADLQNLSR